MTATFLPSHRVPAAGAATFASPDPSLTPGARLDPRLEVQVFEARSDGWAHVLCSNGWRAWVDGRKLEPMTLHAPAAGLSCRVAPDPAAPPSNRLSSGLAVTVLEQRLDGWCHVECSNTWQTWVDGRLLVRRVPIDMSLATALPLVGGIFLLAGSLLPWFSVIGTPVHSWDLPLVPLVLRSSTVTQPRLAPFLFCAAAMALVFAAITAVTRRPAPRWILLVGAALATNVSALALAAYLHPYSGLGIGFGVVVSAAGGAVCSVAHYKTRDPMKRGMWGWL